MSHRWNCPSELDARRKAREDADFDFSYGHGREYRRGPYDCDDGNRAYTREYEREAYVREEEAQEERRLQRRAEERRQDEVRQREYWEAEEAQRQEERDIQEAYFAEMEAMHWWSEEWAPRWLP